MSVKTTDRNVDALAHVLFGSKGGNDETRRNIRYLLGGD